MPSGVKFFTISGDKLKFFKASGAIFLNISNQGAEPSFGSGCLSVAPGAVLPVFVGGVLFLGTVPAGSAPGALVDELLVFLAGISLLLGVKFANNRSNVECNASVFSFNCFAKSK